jgi:hypothetical protein
MNPRWTFYRACFLTRAVLIAFLMTSGVSLMPDEAQYWTWSRCLDLGYYSKPPAIAWQIWLGTAIFGSTQFGIRCVSLLLPIVSALVLQRIVRILTGDEKASWLTATAFIVSPLGWTTSFLATTDSGMVLGWLLATFCYIKEESPHRLLTAGLWIAVGALWKWMTYSFWLVVVADMVCARRHSRGEVVALVEGILISLLGLLPALYWNWSHDFVTFRHVGGTMFAQHTTPAKGNPLAFFGAGVALLTPGFFLMAVPGLFRAPSRWRFIQQAVLVLWGGLLFCSLFRKMQGNWAVIAQVMCFPLVGWVLAYRPSFQSWPYRAAMVVAIGVQLIVLAIPYGMLPWDRCPLTQGMGWECQAAVEQQGYRPGRDFLFSDRYQTTSLLWFHGPEQRKAYFLNLHGLRQNQYCYWPGLDEECRGKTGFFVAAIPSEGRKKALNQMRHYRSLLFTHFERVSRGVVYLVNSQNNRPIRSLVIIRCQGYHGFAQCVPRKY